MRYRIVIADEIAAKIAQWGLSAELQSLIYRRLDSDLGDSQPNGGPYPPVPNSQKHRLRLADPDPFSDAVYTFVFLIHTDSNVHRIVESSFMRIGGPPRNVL